MISSVASLNVTSLKTGSSMLGMYSPNFFRCTLDSVSVSLLLVPSTKLNLRL